MHAILSSVSFSFQCTALSLEGIPLTIICFIVLGADHNMHTLPIKSRAEINAALLIWQTYNFHFARSPNTTANIPLSSNIMTDLIVDFPTRGSSAKKTVQFSNMTQIRFIEPIDQDVAQFYYSSKDYKAMRLATKNAVRQANEVLGALSSSSDQESEHGIDEDLILAGIENILTPAIIKRTRSCRAQYTKAVLDEQERQDSTGLYDADRLAFVSHQYSKSAVRRAHKIGLMQSR